MKSRNLLTDDQKAVLSAMIDAALADVRSSVDFGTISECRAIFRKKVPFNMRSWVAASLLLSAQAANPGRGRQAGRGQNSRTEREAINPATQTGKGKKPAPATQSGTPNQQGQQNQLNQGRKQQEPRAERAERTERVERTERNSETGPFSRENRYQGEGSALFVSAGRRQRFYARVALKMLADICEVPESSVGDIRTMDNYSFISIDPAVEEKVISSLNGTPFKGRPLTVNLARKRDEADNLPEDSSQESWDENTDDDQA